MTPRKAHCQCHANGSNFKNTAVLRTTKSSKSPLGYSMTFKRTRTIMYTIILLTQQESSTFDQKCLTTENSRHTVHSLRTFHVYVMHWRRARGRAVETFPLQIMKFTVTSTKPLNQNYSLHSPVVEGPIYVCAKLSINFEISRIEHFLNHLRRPLFISFSTVPRQQNAARLDAA